MRSTRRSTDMETRQSGMVAGVAPDAAERLARCVATMVYYEADGWSWDAAQFLWEETQSLLEWAESAGGWEAAEAAVLGPLEAELVARFGPARGARLHRE